VGGFPGEVYDTLWAMVWAGEVSNDTLRPVRSLLGRSGRNRRSAGSSASGVHHSARPFRSRRGQQQGTGLRTGTEGRFSLVRGAWLKAEDPTVQTCSATERATARVRQLVRQWGVVTREAVAAGKRAGGFSGTYPVLKALDDTGELQRGYWIEGMGATQFVAPGVVSQLRTHRHPPKEPQ